MVFRTTVERRKLVTEMDKTLKIPGKTLWDARSSLISGRGSKTTVVVGLSRIGFGVK
jgi:hypothetical protein